MSLDDIYRFLGTIDEKDSNSIEVNIANVAKYLHYIIIDKEYFTYIVKEDVGVLDFSAQKKLEIEAFLKEVGAEEYRDFICFVIAKIRDDIRRIRIYNPLEQDFKEDILNKGSGLKELYEILEYYIQYEKSSGAENALLNCSISFKPPIGAGISIKNGLVIHRIISTIFTAFTEVEDAYKVNDDSWKRAIEKKFAQQSIAIPVDPYLTSVVTCLRRFFIEEQLYKGDTSKVMPTRIANWIITLLNLADFEIEGKNLDKDNVRNWYKNGLK